MLLFNWFSCNLQGAQTILTPNFLLPLCFISPWPFASLVATQQLTIIKTIFNIFNALARCLSMVLPEY